MSILIWSDTEAGDFSRDQAISTQLGALLTLATGRRIQVASSEVTVRAEGSSTLNFVPGNFDDRELYGPVTADPRKSMESLLALISGLQSSAVAPISAAIELHYGATLLFDKDINTASTLLVAGVEALAAHFESSSPIWEDFQDAQRFDAMFDELRLTDTQSSKLREEILKGQHLRLQHRFSTYVSTRLDPAFWDQEVQDYVPSLEQQTDGVDDFKGYAASDVRPIDTWVPRDATELRRRLVATYTARSRFVHAGKKSHSVFTSINATLSQGDSKAPIAFIGMRRILRRLIELELAENSTPAALPALRFLNEIPQPTSREKMNSHNTKKK